MTFDLTKETLSVKLKSVKLQKKDGILKQTKIVVMSNQEQENEKGQKVTKFSSSLRQKKEHCWFENYWLHLKKNEHCRFATFELNWTMLKWKQLVSFEINWTMLKEQVLISFEMFVDLQTCNYLSMCHFAVVFVCFSRKF